MSVRGQVRDERVDRQWVPREYEANGNGGQYLIVLPDLDLVVVFTGGDYNRYRIWRQWRDNLLPEYLIPAATTDQH